MLKGIDFMSKNSFPPLLIKIPVMAIIYVENFIYFKKYHSRAKDNQQVLRLPGEQIQGES